MPESSLPPTSGEIEVVVLVKAMPNVSTRKGETMCCAGVDLYGNWRRLYPISFRALGDQQKFTRWDRIKLKWRRNPDDRRKESCRVDQNSIEIISHVPEKERANFVNNSVVTSLDKEKERGNSLALLQPEIIDFRYQRRSDDDVRKINAQFMAAVSNGELFANELEPLKACPYDFIYRYRTEDGVREGTCQDWEISATYNKWSQHYGIQDALDKIEAKFGTEMPNRGLMFAMSTHSQWPSVWLLSGLIRISKPAQTSFI